MPSTDEAIEPESSSKSQSANPRKCSTENLGTEERKMNGYDGTSIMKDAIVSQSAEERENMINASREQNSRVSGRI